MRSTTTFGLTGGLEVANRKSIEVYMAREAHALLSALITFKRPQSRSIRRMFCG